jgi:hypothetical protein
VISTESPEAIVKQKLNVLGLGLDRFFWKKFSSQMQDALSNDQIEFSFELVKYKWSKFKETGLALMNEFKPDFIFTSWGLFKNQQDFEAFFQSYQPSELIDYPNLFLIERKPLQFFKQYLKVHPYSEFRFKQYPGFKIGRAGWFSNSESNPPMLEIDPPPNLSMADNVDFYLDKEGTLGFAEWCDIKSIEWKSGEYKPKEFCEEIAQALEDKKLYKLYKGVFFHQNQAFLSSGFHLRDLVRFETDYLPIDHVIGYRETREMGVDYQSLLQKVVEIAKYRSSLHFNESYYREQETIKAIIPVTISATSPVLCSIFKQILKFEGYQKTVTADLTMDSAERFLVTLLSGDESPKTYSHPIMMEESISSFEGLENLRGETPLSELEYEDLKDSIKIKNSISRIENQQKKLNDQHKVLTSSKLQADKKRYMDMISSTKLELLKNLLEISEIWNEQNCDVAVGSRENVLILYDESSQADMIDKQLEHNNRKHFLDAYQEISSLESLVKLNTDEIEPFLHDGVVICCMTTRALLVRRFQQFEQELSEKEYAPLGEAIESVELEITNAGKRLQRQLYLEMSSKMKVVYDYANEELFSAAQSYVRDIEKKKYSVKSSGRVGIITEDTENCHHIKKAFQNTFIDFNNADFQLICPELCQEDTLETELMEPSQQLSVYFRSIAAELGLQDFDFFVLNGNLVLQTVLIEFLRQEGSKYVNTPIVLLASGYFEYDTVKELSKQRVKILYQDPYRKGSSEALSHTLKTLLSMH